MNLLVFLSVAAVTLATETSVPGCHFGSDEYPIGSVLPSSNCFRLRCQEILTWEIDDIAKGCKVSKFENGGGVRSYDNFCTPYFKDNGICHYTLSTYWNPEVTYPALDVETIFAEYEPCPVLGAVFPTLSCIEKTRYETDSIEIIVTNDDNSQMLVDGESFNLNGNLKTVVAGGAYQEVVAQKIFEECALVIGKLNSLIACPYAVFVFAGTSLDFTLNGLSGYYDGSVSPASEDDQTRKDASDLATTFWTHPDTFPLSWRSNPECISRLAPLPDGSTNQGCDILPENILDCNEALEDVPATYVYLPALKITCKETLCEASPPEVNFWKMQVKKSAELEVQLMNTFPIPITYCC